MTSQGTHGKVFDPGIDFTVDICQITGKVKYVRYLKLYPNMWWESMFQQIRYIYICIYVTWLKFIGICYTQ